MDYKKTAGIDLHIHSNASDGTFSPQDILRQAVDSGLKAIAITDHDTVSGAKELAATHIPASITFVVGVEISAAYPSGFSLTGSLHILGYAVNPDDPDMLEALSLLQDARKNRNPLIIEKLNSLNLDISLEEVARDTDEQQIGRPHIAHTMVKKGIVNSIDEAFDVYLGRNRPAYVDKYRVDCEKAIALIRNAGGIPVLAHPFLLPRNDHPFIKELLLALIKMGLGGIEVYYPQHPPDETLYYAEMADRLGLIKTGGTDFHGALTPDIKMGIGQGDFHVPFGLYEALITAVRDQSP